MEATKKKKSKVVTYTLIGFVVFAAIYSFMSESNLSPAEKRQREIEKQFSALNGQHENLTSFIKDHLNDPGSYKNVETNFWDMDTAIVVNQKYSAKNEYGGVVQHFTKASVDTAGNIRFIIEQR